MEEADKDWMMIRMVGVRVFLLVPAHPVSPGQRAVKWLLCCCCVLRESDIFRLVDGGIVSVSLYNRSVTTHHNTSHG